MYGIAITELNDFAIAYCRQQITAVYGEDSPKMIRYQSNDKQKMSVAWGCR